MHRWCYSVVSVTPGLAVSAGGQVAFRDHSHHGGAGYPPEPERQPGTQPPPGPVSHKQYNTY